MTLGDQERYKEFVLKKEIKTLKAQIEKMKCCDNCKHRLKVLEMEVLDLDKDELREPCNVCNNYDKWEIRK
nr:MAG TPA: hypothetical protein [Caudoviricetes sp.]